MNLQGGNGWEPVVWVLAEASKYETNMFKAASHTAIHSHIRQTELKDHSERPCIITAIALFIDPLMIIIFVLLILLTVIVICNL